MYPWTGTFIRLVLSTGLIHQLYRIWIDRSIEDIDHSNQLHCSVLHTWPLGQLSAYEVLTLFVLLFFYYPAYSLLFSLSLPFLLYPSFSISPPHVPVNNDLPLLLPLSNVLPHLQQQPVPSRFHIVVHRQPETTDLVSSFAPLKVVALFYPRLLLPLLLHTTIVVLRQLHPSPSTIHSLPSHHIVHFVILPFLALRHSLQCRCSCSGRLQTYFAL